MSKDAVEENLAGITAREAGMTEYRRRLLEEGPFTEADRIVVQHVLFSAMDEMDDCESLAGMSDAHAGIIRAALAKARTAE